MLSPRRDERGAVFPITILLIGVMLLLTSLVVDIGGDRIVRRDMQSVADVVALDLVRELDGRTASTYSGFDAGGPSTTLLASAKSASVNRQAGLIASPDSVGVRLAVADKDTGAFEHFAAAGEVPNAVRVYAAGSSAFRFLPATSATSGIERQAFAVIGPPIVCISAGATLADLTPGGTLDLFLGRLIGIDRLSIVSPSGVAALSGQIPLGDLATQLGVGTVDEIATADITANELIVAAATVMSNRGEIATATVLNAIAARLTGTTDIDVGEILALNTGTGSAASLALDAFSLVQSVIQVSNKENFVNLSLSTGITKLQAKVIEAPKIACGPVGTRAESAQIQVRLEADLDIPIVSSVKINPLAVTVGDGGGQVNNITCTVGGGSVGVTADTATAKLKLNLAIKLLFGLVTITVQAPDLDVKPNGAEVGTQSSLPLTFTFPQDSGLPAAQTAGTGLGTLGLSSITPIKISPLGSIGSTLLGNVLGLVDGLLSPVVNPILESLGIRIGTVKIQPTSRPACNEPVLRD